MLLAHSFFIGGYDIKYYGRLIDNLDVLTTETVRQTSTGVTRNQQGDICQQCGNTDARFFYTYYSKLLDTEICYCRKCIQLGRMDNVNQVYQIASEQFKSEADYHLPFELSAQQTYASSEIVAAVTNYNDLLLYAVTGAGKTEMIFEAIQLARRRGDNVAVVSPRVDVVIEISYRLKDAFTTETIDVLYKGQTQHGDGHFVIATVHQLYRFKAHFDVVFVDEVDAFPLAGDPTLTQALHAACKERHAIIYMTATPPNNLLQTFDETHIVRLPARFHQHPLPVPQFQLFKLKPRRRQLKLMQLFQEQVEQQRYTLVFFNHIDTMVQAYTHYQHAFPDLIYVHSEDALRHDKVQALREGKHRIVFTTTILERGFTMAKLDAIVVNSHTFKKAALVQIAGRVGRKKEAPTGRVLFLHEGITGEMLRARRDIRAMNRLALERGWIHE